MGENKNNKWLFAVIVLVIIVFVQLNKLDTIKKENANFKYELIDLENYNDELLIALDEANSNIEQANSNIEDAQGYAWSSYDDMGYALDNLETVYTVDSPY